MKSTKNDIGKHHGGWTRRRFGQTVASSLLLAGGGYIGQAQAAQAALVEAAKKEGRVTVYGDSSMVPQYIEGFQKRYPEIRVNSVPGGAWQSYNRMQVERSAGRVLADILCATDDALLAGYKAGVLEKLDTTAGFPPDSVTSANYVITQRMLTPIIYNAEATKDLKLPTDWEDFTTLGDDWKGLIISADPRNSGTALCVLMGLYKALGKERAGAILAAWKRLGVEIAPNTGVQVAKLMSGERPLTVNMHMAFYKTMKEKGAPVRFLLPKSGSMMQVGAAAVPKGAPHPNAGKLFLDFIMSPDGAKILADNGTYPASTESVVPKDFPVRKTLKIVGPGPEEMLRDRDMIIEWWKSGLGVT